MLFQWTRLGLNQFRLLERRTPLPSGEPSYVLKTFTLNSTANPRYAAIIYAISENPEEARNESVVLNGRSFSVTPTALEALKKVEENKGEGYEYLWIDALCINHKDEAEKRNQEGVVERIFESADMVIAALPVDTPELDAFCTQARAVGNGSANESMSFGDSPAFSEFLRLGQLVGGQQIWSKQGTISASKIVLYAGRERFNAEEVSEIFGACQKSQEEGSQSKSKESSL